MKLLWTETDLDANFKSQALQVLSQQYVTINTIASDSTPLTKGGSMPSTSISYIAAETHLTHEVHTIIPMEELAAHLSPTHATYAYLIFEFEYQYLNDI